jgi:hypothetical protein
VNDRVNRILEEEEDGAPDPSCFWSRRVHVPGEERQEGVLNGMLEGACESELSSGT